MDNTEKVNRKHLLMPDLPSGLEVCCSMWVFASVQTCRINDGVRCPEIFING